MNNKVVLWLSGIVVVVGLVAAGVYMVLTQQNNTPTPVKTGDQALLGATKTACDIFTPEIATQILGQGTTKAELPGEGSASSETVSVTNCLYENATGTASYANANILVRGAKTADAFKTNDFGFSSTRTQSISGEAITSDAIANLGDQAYYNPSFKQVNVLINGGQYWLIIQAKNEKAAAEQLARLVVANL